MRKSHRVTGDEPFPEEIELNREIIKFPSKTNSYAIYDNKLIVCLYPYYFERNCTNEDQGRNIWCYKDDGTLLWKIEESPYWLEWLEKQSPEDKQRIFARGHKDYYSHIAYNKDPKTGEEYLVVGTTTGYYDLDPETGKVSNFEYNGGRG